MQKRSLGDQELALLRHIAQHGPMTVGEATEGFGEPQGWARSTVVTVMERLRQKGYLTRIKREGVFQYASLAAQEEIMGGLVQQFVEKTLSGSLTPFVTYFSQREKLSEQELAELERLIAKLQAQDEETKP